MQVVTTSIRQDPADAAQILNRFVEDIMTGDDDTVAYKIQFDLLSLIGVTKQLNIEVTPIVQLISDVSPIAQLEFQRLYDVQNPVCNELTNSPPAYFNRRCSCRCRRHRHTSTSTTTSTSTSTSISSPRPNAVVSHTNSLCIQVQALRTEFEAALAHAQFSWTKNNKTTNTKFTESEIASTSSLIFDDVFNTNGLNRALAIVESYRNHELGSKPISATIIAGRLSLDARLRSGLREFFSMYSSFTRSPTKSSAVESMLALYEKYKLYNSYL